MRSKLSAARSASVHKGGTVSASPTFFALSPKTFVATGFREDPFITLFRQVILRTSEGNGAFKARQ
jgi:hypothetical protein